MKYVKLFEENTNSMYSETTGSVDSYFLKIENKTVDIERLKTQITRNNEVIKFFKDKINIGNFDLVDYYYNKGVDFNVVFNKVIEDIEASNWNWSTVKKQTIFIADKVAEFILEKEPSYINKIKYYLSFEMREKYKELLRSDKTNLWNYETH